MYGSVTDMVDRFGEEELIQLTTPKGEPMETVRPDRIERALTDASGVVDSYLRRRYQVPVDNAPPEIVAAAAHLARYDLAQRGDTGPSDQMKSARREHLAWLKDLSDGRVTLDGALPIGDVSFARTSDRSREAHTGGRGGRGFDTTSMDYWD